MNFIKMIKGVIFDMDGVIVDSEPLHEECEKKVMKEYGIKLTPETFAEVKGLRDKESFAYYTQKFNINERPEILMQKKMLLYNKLMKSRLKVYPGFKSLAKQCKQKFKVGLATSSSKEAVSVILKEFDMKHLFDAIVTAEDVSLSKPYPESYLKIAEKLHVKANQCLVIEDTVHGITAAKTAGAKCVAVTHTFTKKRLQETSADHIVSSLRSLKIEYMKKL
ncbi:HAD family phosphatase [Candidatus Woesearchaeota archaeon]|nr:HAD family phosphatase [Candidatus Woesearchaeota archaeon]